MENTTFLHKLAQVLIKEYSDNLSNTIIILPNRRAKVFLLAALLKQTPTTIFAPEIISIEDFVQDIAVIRSIDNVALLFEFYSVYLEITPTDQ